MVKIVSSNVRRMKRILLRSGKSPYVAVTVEEALHRDVFATNSGNLIFSDAAHKILETPDTEVVSNGIQSNIGAAARINEEYDAFVVPLANAFRPSFEANLKRLTQLISRLRIPVVVLGVGAQTGVDYDPARLKRMEPAVREFCAAVLDHSASIGVRGEFTERYLKDMGFRDVEVIGCPSLFMYGDRLPVEKGPAELTTASRIAVNGSHNAVRKQGMGRIIRHAHARYPNLRFIGQNLSDARQLHWRDLSDPNSDLTSIPTHPDHPMYQEDKVRVYIDPVTWIDELRDFDFSFGSRIHGNIAALLAGTPATVLCSDSRTLELCRYFGIPHQLLGKAPGDVDPARLYEAADFGALVGGHRERFDRFTAFLDKNGLRNTFTHGDGGAAFDERMRSLAFPPGVRPWNDTDLASLAPRLGWMHGRLNELTQENSQLKRDLARAKSGARASRAGSRTAKTDAAAAQAAPRPSVYRRARRVVGRPIRRLQSGWQQQ
jgi:Polysaccharide pyruvyl transferase